jgi:uncharacterized delta-60 repeat protein
MRPGKRHTVGLLACLAAAVLALLFVPAVAAARPGALDHHFNGDGKVVTIFPKPERVGSYPNYALPFEFAPGRIAMAAAPGGKIVAASSQAIVRYLANGRRDPGFGGNGAVPIEQINGFRFQLSDVAVDSQGRVLIAGTIKATNGVGLDNLAVPGPLPSIGTIRRYSPNGAPDPSFGSGGVINSYFGAPPATFEGKPYSEPTVSLVGLAVDSQDRPVVTGSSVAEVGRCGASQERYEKAQAFVARRAPDGSPDPGFAGGATAAIVGLSWLALPTPAASGLFAVGADDDPCRSGGPGQPSVVTGIGDSSLNQAFDGDGFWSHPFTRVSDLAAAPDGKIVLLTRTIELSHGKWIESAGQVLRLRPNGARDHRFGDNGVALIQPPRRGSFAALTVDSQGRVLLAGTVKRKPKHGKRAQLRFLLIRTTPSGGFDPRFGHHGQVSTRFGGRANVRASEILVDSANRIVVGGKLAGPKSANAFAIARYLDG